jgi:threonine dehydrogenase-like Zn-dependent dehydrogenase
MYGAGEVQVEEVPDPTIQEPTDALVRVVRSGICGSDLWPYRSMPATEQGRPMGHEFLGIVEDLGADVTGLKRGDLVLTPFVWADNTCDFCAEGLHTSCRHGGRYGFDGVDSGQGEAVRVPQAQGTLVKLPVGEDSALLPSLLTLSDVFCTGHHAAVKAGIGPRTTVTPDELPPRTTKADSRDSESHPTLRLGGMGRSVELEPEPSSVPPGHGHLRDVGLAQHW